jgi:hypothetical protein
MSRTVFSIYYFYRVVALVGVGGAAIWGVWVHPRLVAGRQVANWAIVQSYVAFVDAYHEEHGRFPTSLGDAIPASAQNREQWLAARDNYGRPLHFSSDGAQFVIASYGKDGVPDNTPSGLDDPEIAPGDFACKDPNTDTTYSSSGRVQRCGK